MDEVNPPPVYECVNQRRSLLVVVYEIDWVAFPLDAHRNGEDGDVQYDAGNVRALLRSGCNHMPSLTSCCAQPIRKKKEKKDAAGAAVQETGEQKRARTARFLSRLRRDLADLARVSGQADLPEVCVRRMRMRACVGA